jgi:ribosomal silencing factor RsfS
MAQRLLKSLRVNMKRAPEILIMTVRGLMSLVDYLVIATIQRLKAQKTGRLGVSIPTERTAWIFSKPMRLN